MVVDVVLVSGQGGVSQLIANTDLLVQADQLELLYGEEVEQGIIVVKSLFISISYSELQLPAQAKGKSFRYFSVVLWEVVKYYFAGSFYFGLNFSQCLQPDGREILLHRKFPWKADWKGKQSDVDKCPWKKPDDG